MSKAHDKWLKRSWTEKSRILDHMECTVELFEVAIQNQQQTASDAEFAARVLAEVRAGFVTARELITSRLAELEDTNKQETTDGG